MPNIGGGLALVSHIGGKKKHSLNLKRVLS